MEANTRRAKRSRPSDDTHAASASLEESANALANVEGAMGSSTSNKRDKAASKSKAVTKMERSESIDQLISVAGSLLQDSTATAAAIAESNSASQNYQGSSNTTTTAAAAPPSVPNPIDSQQEPDEKAAATEPPPLPPAATTTASQPLKKRQRESKKNKQSEAKTTAAITASILAADPATFSDNDTANNKKTQIQYNPDVPMTKEQLTAWRREMRRVRNRESAAASRRKVRDRIEELEEEVEVWKKRYEEVMRRLDGGKGEGNGGEEGDGEEEEKGQDEVAAGEGKSDEV